MKVQITATIVSLKMFVNSSIYLAAPCYPEKQMGNLTKAKLL